ncbi:MAG: AbrB family transcriptional regulator, partial [Isosphaeraceae bacterium]
MSESTPTVPGRRLAGSDPVQWAVLVVGSALMLAGLRVLGLPGSWMLGPMIAGVLVGVNGGTIRVPPAVYLAAQS